MNYWLVKTEPSTWSWKDQLEARNQTAHWDGVRNGQAIKNLRAMKRGDPVLFYHSGDDKQIVGVAEVVKEFYPDPADETGKYGMVNLKAIKPLKKPVTLSQIKADGRLKHLALVRQSRLSVMPIDEKSWEIILKMS